MSQLSPLNRKQRQLLTQVDPKNPVGAAMCDGCGFWVPYPHLRQRMQYRGGWSPVGTGLWVCGKCDDVPQPYYQRQVLKPDPVPLLHPRPDPTVTLPAYTTASQSTATTLATTSWVNTPFPPASTATLSYQIATASGLTQNGYFGGGG